MNRHQYVLLVSLVATMGCQAESASTPVDMQVSRLVQDPDKPLQDDPATGAYSALADRFKKGMAVSGTFNVYQLEAPTQPAGLLKAWASQGAVAAKDNPAVADEHRPTVSALVGADQEFSFNALSGTKTWTNRSLYHKGAGIPTTALMTQASAVQKARAHMMAKLGPEAAKFPLYAYKTNRFLNVVGSFDGSMAPTTTVSQVAVAFNSTVDDLPVIGPGGKIAVDLATDGTPVHHESTIRGISGVAAPIPPSSIIGPEAARASLEKTLTARGVDLTQYRPARSEFGYFRRGRGRVQNVIGPYYAFFYEPIAGNLKGIEEHVPATNDPTALKLLQDDEDREAARKAVLLAGLHSDKRTLH
jgi:hypothetical protein